MCSWCYAFGPEFDAILEQTGLEFRMVMGGLFVGDRTQPLDDGLRAYLSETWARVSEMSGRPVATDLLELQQWTYDTEPSCRAVVAARSIEQELTRPLFERIQTAFYAENLDTTDDEVLIRLAVEVGLDETAFRQALESDAIATETHADFAEGRRLGAAGFPTLLLDRGSEQIGSEMIVVSAGYNRAKSVTRTITVMGG